MSEIITFQTDECAPERSAVFELQGIPADTAVDEKIAAIERVDANIVGPVWETLKESGDYRMLVVPDHATPIRLRTHTAAPVPFAICGTGVESVVKTTLTEKAGEAADLKVEVGHELMKHLLGK